MDKLEEYLVSLGFEVNRPSYRHFADALLGAESMAKRTGEAVLGVAFAVEAMVAKVAAQQNQLYFVSQRTGASVASLQAYEFGMTQIGVSADAARGAVEGFASALRSNPGLGGLARSLGVTDLSNSVRAQHQLIGRLRKMPDFIAQQFAGMFGMDQQTYINLKNNFEVQEKYEKAYLKRQKDAGVGTDEAKRKFRAFSETLGVLEGDWEILEQRMGLDWVGPATHILELVDKLIVGFNNMDGSTRKLVMSVLTLWGAFKSIGALAGIARKLGIISTGAAATPAGATASSGLLAGMAGLGGSALRKGALTAAAGYGLRTARMDQQAGYPLRTWLRDKLGLDPLVGADFYGPGATIGGLSGEAAGAGSAASTSRGSGLGSRSAVEAYIVEAAKKRNIDPAIALAVARSEGLAQYVGDRGSSFGPYQLHYGNVANGGMAVSGLGDDFTRKTGLNARDPNTQKAQIDFALDYASQHGWGPWHGWKGAADAGLGGARGAQTNHIEIHIHGGTNPRETAKHVVSEFGNALGQMTRSGAGAAV